MNKFPAWLNTLVLVILMTGILLALPNIYGSSPALQVAAPDDDVVTQTLLDDSSAWWKRPGIRRMPRG